jgi:hypothetical protein
MSRIHEATFEPAGMQPGKLPQVQPLDGACGYKTFEMPSSGLQPGSAENAIVYGLLDLMA